MATIRTSEAGVPSFKLGRKYLIENELGEEQYWYARRDDLNLAIQASLLPGAVSKIAVFLGEYKQAPNEATDGITLFLIEHGKTQRGKKYIQIGCKRFVGENRRKLIAWAKSAR